MAGITVRVPMPDDPSDAIHLMRSVKDKHTALAAASPLGGLEWDKITAALEAAETQDALSDQCYRDAEKATKERDLQMPAVNDALRSARDVLLGVYRSNPKKAGDFGFTVNDSLRSSANGEAGGNGNGTLAQPALAK